MKSGNLNFLEPSGPLQACNGTALPLYTPSYGQTEDGSKKPKHVAESCKFIKYLIKKLC